MNIYNNLPEGEETDETRNDTAPYSDDTMGENTGDSALAEAAEKEEPFATASSTTLSANDPRVETVVPEGDN